MKKVILLGLLSSFITVHVFSQGCVPIRSTGSSIAERPAFGKKSKPPQWTFSATNRYFKSFRHFAGDEQQKQRVAEGTEVINKSYTLDLNAVRYLNSRWSVGVNVPLISNYRSSLYEHGGQQRHSTESFGLGDVRLTAYRWMLNPRTAKNANVQAGVGVKLPTGNYKYQDDFYTGSDGGKVLGPVDQSIQLGDGGTGIVAELNSFYNINRKVSVYSNLFYLVNPRETNGVSTARGRTPSATSIAYGSNVMSVPDQYMARAGAIVSIRRFAFSAGARIDGVPAEDLVGGSNGFRRPGYTISAEPGITYRTKKIAAFVTVPIAIDRNRIQSVPDKIRTEKTGTYYVGDAAFADYVINLGVSFTLRKANKFKGSNGGEKNKTNTIIRNYYSPREHSNKCGRSYGCQKRVMKL